VFVERQQRSAIGGRGRIFATRCLIKTYLTVGIEMVVFDWLPDKTIGARYGGPIFRDGHP